MHLIVSIDVEEDMPDWRPQSPETFDNIPRLLELQRILKNYGVPPTYLVSWPVLAHESSLSTIKALMSTGECEIGSHVHSWNTPPLTSWERAGKATFVSALSPELKRQKIENFTAFFAERLGVLPTSHRAGRYGFDQDSAQILVDLGYLVDSSIAPVMDYREIGGPDFRQHGVQPFWVETPGKNRDLLEIPISIALVHRFPTAFENIYFRIPTRTRIRGLFHRLNLARVLWLRPTTYSFSEMRQLADYALDQLTSEVLVMMFHSSELHPNGSPYNRTEDAVRQFLQRLERIISYLIEERGLTGVTLSQFASLACASGKMHPHKEI